MKIETNKQQIREICGSVEVFGETYKDFLENLELEIETEYNQKTFQNFYIELEYNRYNQPILSIYGERLETEREYEKRLRKEEKQLKLEENNAIKLLKSIGYKVEKK